MSAEFIDKINQGFRIEYGKWMPEGAAAHKYMLVRLDDKTRFKLKPDFVRENINSLKWLGS